MFDFEDAMIENPIIAAVREEVDLVYVIESNVKIVFVLFGTITNIVEICRRLKAANKFVFVHLDMIEGLRGDFSGIEYIKSVAAPDGIITTKAMNIKYAKQQGLYAIQRIFILDTLSFKTGVKNILDCLPNAVEIMPGIAGKIICNLGEKVKVPIIAGGLIQDKKDIMDALASGAIAVSTSSHKLWNQ